MIGVDEVAGVVGATENDLASWYSSVESHFDELAPRMTPLNISTDGTTVVALLFETERAPFVVKNPMYGSPGGGAVELEVPWRENTSIRSARRSDLVRLLAPIEQLPEIEVLEVEIKDQVEGTFGGNFYNGAINLVCQMYIAPKSEKRLTIPFHKCRVKFKLPEAPILEAHWIAIDPCTGRHRPFVEKPGSLTIESTTSEVIINGPGRVSLTATAKRPLVPKDEDAINVHVLVYLLPIGASRPIVLEKQVVYRKNFPPKEIDGYFLH